MPTGVIIVEQTGSPIRCHFRKDRVRPTLTGLRLGRIGRVARLPDTPETRGMIARVKHIVRVLDSDAFLPVLKAARGKSFTRVKEQNARPHAQPRPSPVLRGQPPAPPEANSHIQTFVQAQKKTFGKCLYGDLTCSGKPVAAHSIQNAKVLERIQTDGHVLMPQYRLVNGEPKIEFVKIGRNDASTFTGLCEKHDTELFRLIDTEPLDVDNDEHLQQLAYRSVMREFHTHLLNAEKSWAVHEELCKAEGVDPANAVTKASIVTLGHYKKGQELLKYRTGHFDAPLSEGKTPDLRHFIITIVDQAPVLAASAFFSTGFAANGDVIGPTLNVVPLNESKSVAVLSYPAGQETEVTAALAALFDADEKSLKYELAKLIIGGVENFALCPAHYETWSDDKKKRVLHEFEASIMGPKKISDHEDLNIFL